MLIRRGKLEDFPALQAIELACFETLRAAGAVHGEAAASSDDELQHYLDHGLLHVVCNVNGEPVGYCGGYVSEGWLHVAEMDVHPDHQKQGLGRLLMAAILSEGRRRGLEGATLTTDRLAPFNAPFYASLGFDPLEYDDCTPRLKAILKAEKAKGLEPERRIAMVLHFTAV